MNIPDGFFENPVSPEYSDLLSTMGAPFRSIGRGGFYIEVQIF